MSHSFIKSTRKPEMERKRRQRINKCLSQIKLLIPEAKELEVGFELSAKQTRGAATLRKPLFEDAYPHFNKRNLFQLILDFL